MPRAYLPTVRRVWVGACLALPMALMAQPQAAQQTADWPQANGTVGAMPRGHADVLRWERAQAAPNAAPQAPSAEATDRTLALPSPGDAVQLAWQAHPSLARVLARLGETDRQRVLGGQWDGIDASLQRRVDGMAELLAVAAHARKAWVEAVAARQVLPHRQAVLDAAEAAHELGQRMVTVGNWSRLQQSPRVLALASARAGLRRAQLAATQADINLLAALQLDGAYTAVAVPARLPDVPAQLAPADAPRQRAQALQAQLPWLEGRRAHNAVRLATATHAVAHAMAVDSRQTELAERMFMAEETVLHYNGMLKSVWDLLEATQATAQAQVATVAAERDFWLAEVDLQWVLQGGQPERLVVPGGGASDTPAAAAH